MKKKYIIPLVEDFLVDEEQVIAASVTGGMIDDADIEMGGESDGLSVDARDFIFE